MSPSPNLMPREPKRIQMACIICRQKKLKCRPAASFTDGRCQRCVDSSVECVYVPVSSDPPTHEPFSTLFQADTRPAGFPGNNFYHNPSSNRPWLAQTGGLVTDPAFLVPQSTEGPSPATANFSHSYPQPERVPYGGYGGPQVQAPNGQTPSGHPATQYPYPGAWSSNYFGQFAQGTYPSGQSGDPRTAESMQYAMQCGEGSTGAVWQGNPGNNQSYPRINMDN
ncbi:hypothetical protein GALMADRAFT_680370 [Galerina marginata CBS 339.88]|uniref:Zn(2)-C6 fungal-type domain-containing protein n=1 Tax=Galerina marginata (strain CBS 339.88) TaxID=685588 RepID=A0A067TKS9_GALM3|nr:hypothetical protein GALMADRAFT_680370 [Galerina marginata CBS 339.88]